MPINYDYSHKFQPIISANTRGHYRQRSLEFKRALAALPLEPGVSVARIAREHGVNANQVFIWRSLYQLGLLGVPALMRDDGLLPVVLARTAPAPAPGNATIDVGRTIMLELGQVQVRIEGQPDVTNMNFAPGISTIVFSDPW